MIRITANELKTKGVTSISNALKESREALISVRGEARYVVMAIEEYDRLRESEIAAAWLQVKRDLAKGEFSEENADEHIARIKAEMGHGL